jgi:hypothetical protein
MHAPGPQEGGEFRQCAKDHLEDLEPLHSMAAKGLQRFQKRSPDIKGLTVRDFIYLDIYRGGR